MLGVFSLQSPASAELNIIGIEDELARNVRTYAALADEPCDAEQWRIRRRFRALENEARQAIEPYGYYRPIIQTSLRFEDECWVADLTVEPGEPVVLRNVDIGITGDAVDDPGFSDLLSHRRLSKGTVLNHATYERYKRDLQVLAADRGYVEASFEEARIDVWPDEGVADIAIDYASGPRYRLGDIRIEQDFLVPELLLGYMALEPGSPFDRSELTRAHSDLSDSGYFDSVQLIPDFEAADNRRIPVIVELTPGTHVEYTVGAGASTDTGPRFRAGFRNYRLNPRGHRIKADLNVATVLQGLSGEYRVPLDDPRSEWMTYTSALSREVTDTFENDTARVGLRRVRKMSQTWLRTYGLDMSYDSFEVGPEKEDSFLIIPSLTLDYRKSGRDLYPDRGRRLVVEFQGTSESLGSSTSFAQVTVRANYLRAIGSKARLIGRVTAGYIETSDFPGLPPSVRYFAGGDQSVRGFQFESLGPENEEGDVIGGTNLLVASLEVERQIRGNFYGALFVDAGNAYNDEEFDPAVGAGFGIKWRSPVGPVRIYVGFPIDEPDRSPRLHLQLGAEL